MKLHCPLVYSLLVLRKRIKTLNTLKYRRVFSAIQFALAFVSVDHFPGRRILPPRLPGPPPVCHRRLRALRFGLLSSEICHSETPDAGRPLPGTTMVFTETSTTVGGNCKIPLDRWDADFRRGPRLVIPPTAPVPGAGGKTTGRRRRGAESQAQPCPVRDGARDGRRGPTLPPRERETHSESF